MKKLSLTSLIVLMFYSFSGFASVDLNDVYCIHSISEPDCWVHDDRFERFQNDDVYCRVSFEALLNDGSFDERYVNTKSKHRYLDQFDKLAWLFIKAQREKEARVYLEQEIEILKNKQCD